MNASHHEKKPGGAFREKPEVLARFPQARNLGRGYVAGSGPRESLALSDHMSRRRGQIERTTLGRVTDWQMDLHAHWLAQQPLDSLLGQNLKVLTSAPIA